MLLGQSQSQGEESKPPGLFRPVLGQVNNQETPEISIEFKSPLYHKTVRLELYGDRVVGEISGASYFFLLQNQIYFEKRTNCRELQFVSRETDQREVFITEKLNDLEIFCEKLKSRCPQKGFLLAYEPLEIIGAGHSTQVFKVRKIEDGILYAVKTCSNSSKIKKQLEILRVMKHPNLIYFHQYYIDEHMVHIVMDYEDGGSLLELIQTDAMNSKFRHQLMKDILNGLEFLRIQGIVHRDLKPENIVYSATDKNFKIADFGLAIFENQLQQKIVGTPGYIAPQLFKISKETPLPASIMTDIYSAGLILYEVFSGKQFYEASSQEELLTKNMKGLSYKSSQSKSDILKSENDVLRKMIRKDPKDRKTSYQIMESKTFNNIKKLYQKENQSSSTESPDKRNSNNSDGDDDKLILAVKNLLKMRSSSN